MVVTESVVCDCNYRVVMEKERFRRIALNKNEEIRCPKCNKMLNDLMTALQNAIEGVG